MEYTSCGRTEKRGQKARARPDCHLAQISLRKDAKKCGLHCDGNFKGLAIPTVCAQQLPGSLNSAAYFPKIKFKSSIKLLNSAEYTVTRKHFFVFLSENLG
jgi:hypothetical protein